MGKQLGTVDSEMAIIKLSELYESLGISEEDALAFARNDIEEVLVKYGE